MLDSTNSLFCLFSVRVGDVNLVCFVQKTNQMDVTCAYIPIE